MKYYRDLNNVVDTSRQEGIEQGIKQERSRVLERQRALVLRLLGRLAPPSFEGVLGGDLPNVVRDQVQRLSLDQLEALNEALLDCSTLDDVNGWLERMASIDSLLP